MVRGLAALTLRAILAASLLAASLLAPFEIREASALAIQTNAVVIDQAGWTDLGSGPIQLNTGGSAVALIATDSYPTESQVSAALTYISTTPYVYQGSSHVYARSLAVPTMSVTVTSTIGSTSASGSLQAPYNWSDPSTYAPWDVGTTDQVVVLHAVQTRYFLHLHNNSQDTVVSCSFGGLAAPGRTFDIRPGGDLEQEARAVWAGSVTCLSAGPKPVVMYVGAS